jgi:tetratricopeptide (TPR) repeat protein
MTSPEPEPTQRRIEDHADGQSRIFSAGNDQHVYVAESAPDRPPDEWQVSRTLLRDVRTFTGRESELRELVESAEGAAGAVVICTVHGMPGVGKTALVRRAAHELAEHFPDGQQFKDLQGHKGQQSADPSEVLADLLTSTGMPAHDIPARIEARAAQWRSRLAGKKVLLVLDDAADRAQVEPLLPGTAGCLVLITSRTARIVQDAEWQVRLDTLPPDKAIELFRRLARRPNGDADAIARLARLCGYLPLAITVLASRLAHHLGWNITDFADEFAAARDRLAELGPEDDAVTASFEMSYKHLPDSQRRLFRLLGLHPGTDIHPDAAAALTDIPFHQCRREMEALSDIHLIEELGRDHYRFHHLIREYARKLANRDEPDGYQAAERLLNYYLDRADKADKHLRSLPGTPVPADFKSRDHALTWLETERSGLIAAASLAESTGLGRVAMQLPLKLDAYLRGRRHFDELRRIACIGLNAARRLGDRHCEGLAMANLGAALWELRKFEEAFTACAEAVAIFQETGEKHEEGLALTNLGIALWKLRRYDEAVSACRDAVRIFHERREKHEEGLALTNLAAALIEERWFEEAFVACGGAVAIFHETGEDYGEGVALDNLAAALAGQSQFVQAISVCQEALIIYRRAGDRHGEGHALANLGAALRKEHRFEESITASQEAVEIFEQTGDRHHQGVALANLAAARAGQYRFEEAATSSRSAAAIFRRTDDPYHEGVALANLAAALMGQSQFGEAISTCQDAAALFRQAGDQRGERLALANLAVAQAGQRGSTEAITSSQDAGMCQGAAGWHSDDQISLTYLTRPRWI